MLVNVCTSPVLRLLQALWLLKAKNIWFQNAPRKRRQFVSLESKNVLASISVFWTLVRVLSILDFTFLDTVLFVKFVETSLHHTSRKRIHFVSLKSKNYLAPRSGFWTLVRVSSILDSTCLEAVLHVNYAQTLFQHQSRKPKNFVSSTSKHYLAPISVFWTLVSVFLNT